MRESLNTSSFRNGVSRLHRQVSQEMFHDLWPQLPLWEVPITSVTKDAATLTLTVVADFPVSQERLWDAYADPRQLERFWGPPTWPATFTRHDFKVGGRAEYFMTGPKYAC